MSEECKTKEHDEDVAAAKSHFLSAAGCVTLGTLNLVLVLAGKSDVDPESVMPAWDVLRLAAKVASTLMTPVLFGWAVYENGQGHIKLAQSRTAYSGPCRPPVPGHVGPAFRMMSGHRSGACRATIPEHVGP